MKAEQISAQPHNQLEDDEDSGRAATECTEIEPDFLTKLRGKTVNKKVEQLRRQRKNAVYIAGRLALAGQITVFYAPPNTGKTLIALKLISESIANGTAGENVFHINLDDTFDGLIEKADLANRHGFHELGPDIFVKPDENLHELVEKLVNEDSARKAVLILDTVKKFVDVMDKKASSKFMTICRRFTAAGGTIIALAHVNKKKNDDDEGIPAGTSDILDDCDCAYVMHALKDETGSEGKWRSVEFLQKKARGPVVPEAIYKYQINHHDYSQMFHSVKLIEGDEVDRVRQQNAIDSEKAHDLEAIEAISSELDSSEPKAQKDILKALGQSGISRRTLIDCLKRWDCPQEDGGLWKLTRGDSNSNCYRLLD